MPETGFKYIDRGYDKTLVLIPGWASDYRIFNTLDLKFNYLLAIDFSLDNFKDNLVKAISDYELGKVSLFGWSLGGFLAVDFGLKYPGLIDELILVGIRKSYDPDKISEIKSLLRKNKKAYLHGFYKECFSNKAQMRWFKDNLFKDYCDKLSLEYLLKGLDYLEKAGLRAEDLSGFDKLHIIHGQLDNIAPINEAKEIAKQSGAKFISIENCGHIPFLNKGFKI